MRRFKFPLLGLMAFLMFMCLVTVPVDSSANPTSDVITQKTDCLQFTATTTAQDNFRNFQMVTYDTGVGVANQEATANAASNNQATDGQVSNARATQTNLEDNHQLAKTAISPQAPEVVLIFESSASAYANVTQADQIGQNQRGATSQGVQIVSSTTNSLAATMTIVHGDTLKAAG